MHICIFQTISNYFQPISYIYIYIYIKLLSNYIAENSHQTTVYQTNICGVPEVGAPLVIIHLVARSVINHPAMGVPPVNGNLHITITISYELSNYLILFQTIFSTNFLISRPKIVSLRLSGRGGQIIQRPPKGVQSAGEIWFRPPNIGSVQELGDLMRISWKMGI